MTDVYDIPLQTIDGSKSTLVDYRNKVVLIVNTASRCGFTPQYAGLEALYRKYKDQGLVVLGFPCNQFGAQEPGDEAQIADFCEKNYGVSFPMFSKVDVNGAEAHPLFIYLKREAPGLLGSEMIKWNFTKFLLDKQGKVVSRFAPTTTPDEIEQAIIPLIQ
ncbi:MAG: glutathione peroxidase [Burkholderiaceae bacterium]|jgi:glutathione peroxidase|nr:glutathione peroxidase [Burkholderiaceae bacterium]NCV86244.1 glutathione peroxidase [Oxalobacteraceae bacterium]NDG06454.1 glutathione peroxidase [Oxalobacteraceae bacterium]